MCLSEKKTKLLRAALKKKTIFELNKSLKLNPLFKEGKSWVLSTLVSTVKFKLNICFNHYLIIDHILP